MYIDLIVIRHVMENKLLIYDAKNMDHKQKAYQADDLEIRYDCAKRCHFLCMDCANDIVFLL